MANFIGIILAKTKCCKKYKKKGKTCKKCPLVF